MGANRVSIGWKLRLVVKLGTATMGFPPAAGAQPAIPGKVPRRGSAGTAARR